MLNDILGLIVVVAAIVLGVELGFGKVKLTWTGFNALAFGRVYDADKKTVTYYLGVVAVVINDLY